MIAKQNWHIIGRSVRGAAHADAELPNQDKIGWYPKSGEGLPLIVAVSDGHGSIKNFRSGEGARLAVETALKVIEEFLKTPFRDFSDFESGIGELPSLLVKRWKAAVINDLKKNSNLSEEERQRLAQHAPEIIETWPEKANILIYGATLLVVVVSESFIIHLQLGDGDILTVSEQGEVTRPLPNDERLFANETTSLCSEEAEQDFRIVFQDLTKTMPELIVVATDGYANSFRDDQAFLKVGSDVLEIIRENGLDEINKNLNEWLSHASREGSGDDISVGIIWRDQTRPVNTFQYPKIVNQPESARSKAIDPVERGRGIKHSAQGPSATTGRANENQMKSAAKRISKLENRTMLLAILSTGLLFLNLITLSFLGFVLINDPFSPQTTPTLPVPELSPTAATQSLEATIQSLEATIQSTEEPSETAEPISGNTLEPTMPEIQESATSPTPFEPIINPSTEEPSETAEPISENTLEPTTPEIPENATSPTPFEPTINPSTEEPSETAEPASSTPGPY